MFTTQTIITTFVLTIKSIWVGERLFWFSIKSREEKLCEQIFWINFLTHMRLNQFSTSAILTEGVKLPHQLNFPPEVCPLITSRGWVVRSIGECRRAPIEPPERNKGLESPYTMSLLQWEARWNQDGRQFSIAQRQFRQGSRSLRSLNDTSHEKCNQAARATPLKNAWDGENMLFMHDPNPNDTIESKLTLFVNFCLPKSRLFLLGRYLLPNHTWDKKMRINNILLFFVSFGRRSPNFFLRYLETITFFPYVPWIFFNLLPTKNIFFKKLTFLIHTHKCIAVFWRLKYVLFLFDEEHIATKHNGNGKPGLLISSRL